MKYIWIDIGTHYAQEYNSIFGSNLSFYLKLLKRILKIFIGKKFLNINQLFDLINYRNEIRKRRNEFIIIFVEANPKIMSKKKVYLKADIIFNLAITDDQNIAISNNKFLKLYFANGDVFSQGNSIYENKKNIDVNDFIWTNSMQVGQFMKSVKKIFDNDFKDYKVFLRLNCEGVEDSIVYSAYEHFGNKLKFVLGSFKDVNEIKGNNASQKLDLFLKEKNLRNIYFMSSVDSWHDSFKEIYNTIIK